MRYALWMQEISTIIGDERFRLYQPVAHGFFVHFAMVLNLSRVY